jgi:hypothetical protein
MAKFVSRMKVAFITIACLASSQGLHAQCANTTTLGISSTCFGTGSLMSSTGAAIFDLAVGFQALAFSTSGSGNTAVGAWAMNSNTTGSYDTGVGLNAMENITNGNYNTALGAWALTYSEAGDGNTAVGYYALGETDTTGGYNTATGYTALGVDTTGSYNVAAGSSALGANTTGSDNVATGPNALNDNTTGSSNVATGANALYDNKTGIDNTAVGASALSNQTAGNGNLALGIGAGVDYSGSESFNILLGNNGVAGESYVMRLGAVGLQAKAFIAGVHGVTSSSGIPVYVNSAGQLGTATSSRRFKEDIADMGAASDVLMKLRPVTFHYKAPYDDGQRVQQYGLIAEEVAEIDPNLVQYGDDGQPLTVRYHFVNAMLLGEVQKQHATLASQAALLARQAAEIANQKSEIATQKTALAALSDRLAKLEAAATAARQ